MLKLLQRQQTLIYPVHNSLLLPLEYIERHVQIVEVRSIAHHPLSLEAFLKRPFLRRGCTLLTAIEEGKRRLFYLECCKGGEEPGLQFVLVNDEEPTEYHEPIGRVFEPTADDRQRMLDVFDSLGTMPLGFTLHVRAVEPASHRVYSQQ
jgi:hypothetical protein